MSKWINETDLLVNIVKKSRYTSKTIGEAIDESQSIEVVRCKDCKFYVPEDDGRCDVIEQFDVPEMFFCGNGERGEAGDE